MALNAPFPLSLCDASPKRGKPYDDMTLLTMLTSTTSRPSLGVLEALSYDLLGAGFAEQLDKSGVCKPVIYCA